MPPWGSCCLFAIISPCHPILRDRCKFPSCCVVCRSCLPLLKPPQTLIPCCSMLLASLYLVKLRFLFALISLWMCCQCILANYNVVPAESAWLQAQHHLHHRYNIWYEWYILIPSGNELEPTFKHFASNQILRNSCRLLFVYRSWQYMQHQESYLTCSFQSIFQRICIRHFSYS